MARTKTKLCPGVPRVDRPEHVAKVTEFGNDAKSKDGLYRICKACDVAYQGAWRAAKKAGVTWERTARPKLTVVPDIEVVDATVEQEAEHAALEAAIESAGGVETPEGQEMLAAAAETAAQARRDARNAARRLARARAREAAQQTPGEAIVSAVSASMGDLPF